MTGPDRRTVLKQLALGAAALGVSRRAGARAPSPVRGDRPLNVLLLVSEIGRAHV